MQARKAAPKTPGTKVRDLQKGKRPIRKKVYKWEPVTIYIYRNGDDVSPAKKLSLIRSDLEDFDKVLLKVGEKLDQQGFIRRLYTLNGDWIRSATAIVNCQQYVAVGGYEQFKHVMYGKLIETLPREFIKSNPMPKPKKTKAPPATTQSPIPAKKNPPFVKLPMFIKKPKIVRKEDVNQKKDVGQTIKKPAKSIKEKTVSLVIRPRVEYIKRPTAVAPPKTPYPKKLTKKVAKTTESSVDTEKKKKAALQRTNDKLKKDGKSPDSEDSAYMSEPDSRKSRRLDQKDAYGRVYFAPTKKVKPKKVAVVNYDEDSGGIYRAKSSHKEAKNAKEVNELRHIPVELPLDEVEATEVGDEVLTRHEEVTEEETEDDVKESSEEDTHSRVLHQKSHDGDHQSLKDDGENKQEHHEPNEKQSPRQTIDKTHEAAYPIAYNREITSARTA